MAFRLCPYFAARRSRLRHTSAMILSFTGSGLRQFQRRAYLRRCITKVSTDVPDLWLCCRVVEVTAVPCQKEINSISGSDGNVQRIKFGVPRQSAMGQNCGGQGFRFVANRQFCDAAQECQPAFRRMSFSGAGFGDNDLGRKEVVTVALEFPEFPCDVLPRRGHHVAAFSRRKVAYDRCLNVNAPALHSLPLAQVVCLPPSFGCSIAFRHHLPKHYSAITLMIRFRRRPSSRPGRPAANR